MTPSPVKLSRIASLLAVAVLAFSPFTVSADDKKTDPAGPQPKPAFTLPVPKGTPPVVQPDPPLPPKSDGTIRLSSKERYVIPANVKLLVFPATKGTIDVMPVAGPLNAYGIFIGGTGEDETKIFTEPFLYIVTVKADVKTSCDLLIMKVGTEAEADVTRVPFILNGGGGVTPNPIVDNNKPKPNDNNPIPVPGLVKRKLQLVVIEETGDARRTRGRYFENEELTKAIIDGGHYRPQIIDQNAVATGADGKDIPAPDAQPYVNEAKKYKLPRFFIIDPAVTVNMSANPPVTNVVYNGPEPDGGAAGLAKLIKQLGG